MRESVTPLYAQPLFQQISGGAWRVGGLELTQHGLKLCAFTAGMRVLDVGCGAGATLELMHAQGLRAVGLDIAPHYSHGPVMRAHAAQIPLAAACLGGIVCECVLSLMQDAGATLSGFARVLRDGGLLLLSDLFVHDSAPAPHLRPAAEACVKGRSCIDGALERSSLERSLTHAGFCIEHFEDHTALLRPLAAQLVWHGLSCAGQGGLGYGLWIARKKTSACAQILSPPNTQPS